MSNFLGSVQLDFFAKMWYNIYVVLLEKSIILRRKENQRVATKNDRGT